MLKTFDTHKLIGDVGRQCNKHPKALLHGVVVKRLLNLIPLRAPEVCVNGRIKPL